MLLHADALCNPRMLEAADASLERGAVGGWFQVDLLPESGKSTNTLRLLSWGINLRTRWFTTATADQALFTSREVLLDLGGVPDLPLMEGIALARALRARGAVVVLGHPAYYPRFGFASAAGRGIGDEYGAPPETFMVLELVPGALDGVAGTARYDPALAG